MDKDKFAGQVRQYFSALRKIGRRAGDDLESSNISPCFLFLSVDEVIGWAFSRDGKSEGGSTIDLEDFHFEGRKEYGKVGLFFNELLGSVKGVNGVCFTRNDNGSPGDFSVGYADALIYRCEEEGLYWREFSYENLLDEFIGNKKNPNREILEALEYYGIDPSCVAAMRAAALMIIVLSNFQFRKDWVRDFRDFYRFGAGAGSSQYA